MISGGGRGASPHDQRNAAGETTIPASAEDVFAVLADPASHPAIDGTGWVAEALDAAPLTGSGQTFRMAMYHANHPDGSYEMINRVTVFDPPRAIAWEPGYDAAGDGNVRFGGWIWRYDLVDRRRRALRSRSPTTGRGCPRPSATSRSRRSP